MLPHSIESSSEIQHSEMSPSLSFDCKTINIGGRKSLLAVRQSEIVRAKIEEVFPGVECPIVAINTLGDVVQSKALYSFGGKAVWTKELEILLQNKVGDFPRLDLIVHSLKDMPTNLPEEFQLGCILDREDPRDALVMRKDSKYSSLDQLPAGTCVGTSSLRRSSQLLKRYPHLKIESVRGNLQTRLKKLDDPEGPFECIILAAAGLHRVNLGHRITKCLDAPEMFHAVGQGALGIEIRKNDKKVLEVLKHIENIHVTYCCLAERSLMRYLEGGCSVPIGVQTHYDPETSKLTFKGMVVSPDGTEYVEDEVCEIVNSREEATQAGIKLGDILIAKGAKVILENINFERINNPPSPVDSNAASPV